MPETHCNCVAIHSYCEGSMVAFGARHSESVWFFFKNIITWVESTFAECLVLG